MSAGSNAMQQLFTANRGEQGIKQRSIYNSLRHDYHQGLGAVNPRTLNPVTLGRLLVSSSGRSWLKRPHS
jgi:hypothetical protein